MTIDTYIIAVPFTEANVTLLVHQHTLDLCHHVLKKKSQNDREHENGRIYAVGE